MDDLRNLSILLLIFSGVLFLYVLTLFATKNTKLIPRSYAAKMKDKKAYTEMLAVVMALVAAVPLAAGLIGLLSGDGRLTVRVLLGGIVLALAIGVDLMKKVT
ncbi:MAG: hypothetical protein K6C08_00825 [Oscillospiraceae bacterium]|nr:hypothetical protein [Oscillospiraceae bacterium]